MPNLDISNPWLILAGALLAIFGPKIGLGPLLAVLKPLLERLRAPSPLVPSPIPDGPVPLEPAPANPLLPKLLDLLRIVLARRSGVQSANPDDPDEQLVKWLEAKLQEEAAKPAQ